MTPVSRPSRHFAGLESLRKLSIQKFRKLSNVEALGSLKSACARHGVRERPPARANRQTREARSPPLYGCDLTDLPLDELAGLTISLPGFDRARADRPLPLAKLPKLEKVRAYGYADRELKGRDELADKLIDGKNGVKDFGADVFDCSE